MHQHIQSFIHWMTGSFARLAWGGFGAIATLPTLLSPPAFAQLRPVADATSGNEQTVVTPDGVGSDRITGGAIRGVNLFHSFDTFSIDTDRSAYFANPEGIRNIFSRVTGSSRSEILGTLGVSGNANLYLLNPNGILFGPNARLDVQGSFLASTGDRFVFPGGTEFSAVNPQSAPLLSVNLTPGLQYGSNSATLSNRGNLTAGGDLTLAAPRLELQGQLQAGRNLILLAGNTVELQDTTTNPFIATAGGNLAIQGNAGISILALSHPQSRLTSGSSFNLISNGAIRGDARFYSGGNWSTQTSTGVAAGFNSQAVPIIYANGDVLFGNYTGAALKVETTGNIWGGNITITNPGCAVGLTVCAASIPATDPDFTALTQRGVILRSRLAFVPGVTVFPVAAPSAIALQGLPPGIRVGRINTSDTTGGNAGPIFLSTSQGNILTGQLDASSRSTSGNSGNGGSISLSTTEGSIWTQDVSSSSFSQMENSSNGGAIRFSTTEGSITTADVSSFSIARGQHSSNSGHGGSITLSATNSLIRTGELSTQSFSDNGSSRDGGRISVFTTNASITVSNLDASSESTNHTGNGGAISLSSTHGHIATRRVRSISASRVGIAANGGAFTVSTTDGNIRTRSITTYSRAGDFTTGRMSPIIGNDSRNGGRISLSTTNGNITIEGITQTIGSETVIVSSLVDSSSVALGAGDSGVGGDIRLVTAQGHISVGVLNSSSSSRFGNSQHGGDIYLSTGQGNITADNVFSLSSSEAGNSGTGGNIHFAARRGDIVMGGLFSFSFSKARNSHNAGAVSLIARNLTTADQQTRTELPSQVISSSIAVNGTAGNGGSVVLEASDTVRGLELLTLSSSRSSGDVLLESSANLSVVDTKILTNQEIIVDLRDAGTITLPNVPTGQSGNVTIRASGDIVFDSSQINSDTRGNHPAGNIKIHSSGLVRFRNQSQITSNTSSTGRAGNITIQANHLILEDQARISATTTSRGQGGNLTISNADQLRVREGSSIRVSSQAGQAGNLKITNVGWVLLDSGTLEATAGAIGGGNIELDASGLFLLLSNRSRISAAARNAADGGNINLQVPNGIIVANQNSDIVASADQGQGGGVVIKALQTFGAVERLQETPLSDIVVSSTFGPSGTVAQSTTGINPSQGLTALPGNFAPPVQVDQRCATGGRLSQSNEPGTLTVTGRGGLPPNAGDSLGNDAVQVDLVTSEAQSATAAQHSLAPRDDTGDETVVEAQGWTVNPVGSVVLTRAVPTVGSHPLPHLQNRCPHPLVQ